MCTHTLAVLDCMAWRYGTNLIVISWDDFIYRRSFVKLHSSPAMNTMEDTAVCEGTQYIGVSSK